MVPPPLAFDALTPLGSRQHSRGSPIGRTLGHFGLAGLGLAVPLGAGVVSSALHWYWRYHLRQLSTSSARNGIGGTEIHGSRDPIPGS